VSLWSTNCDHVLIVFNDRNAFLLYRSEFLAQKKVVQKVEQDHRHLSRIIGHCWRGLSSEEKKLWHSRAERKRLDHKRKYPSYKYQPVARARPARKRKVKPGNHNDISRCREIAELIMAGKEGEELNEELVVLQPSQPPLSESSPRSASTSTHSSPLQLQRNVLPDPNPPPSVPIPTAPSSTVVASSALDAIQMPVIEVPCNSASCQPDLSVRFIIFFCQNLSSSQFYRQ
jgi:hypothetical protein